MQLYEIFDRAGFLYSHGIAFQEVANATDRIIVSRCPQRIGIQLIEENYASKGFGIKAKSCDWGPFAGFALNHFQYCKLNASFKDYQKQINYLSNTEPGFSNENIKLLMARPGVLRVTTNRLRYLSCCERLITITPKIRDGAIVSCLGPFNQYYIFKLVYMPGSPACWAFLHLSKSKTDELQNIANNALYPKENDKLPLSKDVDPQKDWGTWTLVKGIVNTLPEDRNTTDNAKNCVTGDYDLWGVFPRKGSSMAKHGMDRQLSIIPGVNPQASTYIKGKVKDLENSVREGDPIRTYKKNIGGTFQTFTYREDPELGNISPLVFDTVHKLNLKIRQKGYLGGRMVHHNDDMGNPHCDKLEKMVIAFIPGREAELWDNYTYYNEIRKYQNQYLIVDNWAIYGNRGWTPEQWETMYKK